jgi:hypothetical protein
MFSALTSLGSRTRIILFAVILCAASVHLLNTGYADWRAGADTAYVMGLLLLFFTGESVDDERIQSLKLKSIYVGFFSGWAVVGAIRFVSYLNTGEGFPRSPSAYDAMFIILTIAFALFHFWRFRDGRRGAEAGVLR